MEFGPCDTKKHAQGKNDEPRCPQDLYFCFDGTCNDPGDADEHANDESVTNIAKLHAMFGGVFGDDESPAPDGGKQRSFYYSGVGTYGGWLRKTFNMMSGIPSGDVGKIIKAGLKDFEYHCKPMIGL